MRSGLWVAHVRAGGSDSSRDPHVSVIDTSYLANQRIPRLPLARDIPAAILAQAGLTPAFHELTTRLPPQIAYAEPSVGTASTELRVLIGGSGFGPETRVSWGERDAVTIERLSAQFLTATAPAGAALSQLVVTTATGRDRVAVDDTDPNLQYRGTWAPAWDLGSYRNDGLHTTNQDGASFSYVFTGPGIEVISPVGPAQGTADVSIDDKFWQTVSCYGTYAVAQQVCARVTGLSDGLHILTVRKRGGALLTLDALRVLSASNP
ncbi:MAG: hypothetical protein RL701_7265 [Pseudomonadota bacterium]|jgi:hypothetical protein